MLWNYVCIKATLCGVERAIPYHCIKGDAGSSTPRPLALTTPRSRQDEGPAGDPAADDGATLGLDLLVCEAEFQRGAVMPSLLR